MNGAREAAANIGELPPLPALLLAYAPAARRDWQRLCWLLDQRLAAVVRRAGDPTIKAIRLAWWDEALVRDDRAKGRGEPLVEAWRASAPAGSAARAERLIDGWRLLLAPAPLDAAALADYGAGRGGGLFALIAGEASESLTAAGSAWALWDLAGHAGSPALAQAALAQARTALAGEAQAGAAQAGVLGLAGLPRDRALKPLRLLHDLVVRDIAAERAPLAGFEPRHYRRLLWRGMVG